MGYGNRTGSPGFRQAPVGSAIATLAYGSWNAWMLGRANVGRERCSQMMVAVNANNPHDLGVAGHHAAVLANLMREHEQACAFAARELELFDNHNFPNEAP